MTEFAAKEAQIMKIRRYKRAQRIIGFYRHRFGFKPPYRVLVDGTFSKAALDNRINLREQLFNYLSGETEIVTTACVLKELGRQLSIQYSERFTFGKWLLNRASFFSRTTRTGAIRCIAHLQTV